MIYALLSTFTVFLMVLIVYHHVVYPLLMKLIQARKATDTKPKPSLPYAALPSITLILPAYNEANYIADKLRNLSILSYPEDKLRVVVACDGCTDETVAVAKQALAEPECQHLNVDIRDYSVNRGKVAVINDVMSTVDSDLVALSDISALSSMDALLIAAGNLADDKVGVVTGHYRLLNPGSSGEQQYWQYQSALKKAESALGATMGAHGAFYVFKAKLFQPLEADTINDDFILPMRIVAQGYQAIYEPLINALELEKATQSQDIQRRKRISSGNMQQLLRLKYLVLPKYKGVAFTFFSGKTLRVLMPFMLLIVLFNSFYLALFSPFWLFIVVSQLMVYTVALWFHYKQPKHLSYLQIIYYLVAGHTANLVGATRYLLGKDKGQWERVS